MRKRKKSANQQWKEEPSPERETARRFQVNKPPSKEEREAAMGSPLGGWPSYNPQNFSQLVPADPSSQPSNVTPATYIATHKTDPPPNQVITTESKNILLRHFYQESEKKLRPKRAAPDSLAPENNNKLPRGSQSSSRS